MARRLHVALSKTSIQGTEILDLGFSTQLESRKIILQANRALLASLTPRHKDITKLSET